MSKVFVGNVTPEGDRLLQLYLDKYMPDAVVEPLKQAGIRSKMKNRASRPDVALVVIDEVLYNLCEGVADDVLCLPKVHKYKDDAGLKEFLISKFGVIPEANEEIKEEPIDVGMPTFTENTSDADELERLRYELEQSQLLCTSLQRQLSDNNKDSDIPLLVEKIRNLETELKETKSKLSAEVDASYMARGKIAKAEEVIKELDTVKKDLQLQREFNAKSEFDKRDLSNRVEELTSQVGVLESYQDKYEAIKVDLASAQKEYKEAYALYESKCDEYAVLMKRLDSVTEELNAKDTTISGLKTELNGERESYTVKSAEQSKEITTLQNNISSKEVELEKLRLELDKSAGDLANKEEEYKALQKTVNDLQTALGVKSEEVEKVKESIVEKDNIIKSLTDSNEQANTTISELKQELENSSSSLKEELDSANETISELRSEINVKEGTTKEVSEELESAKVTISDLQSEIGGKEESLKDLSDRLEEAQRTISELQDSLNKASEDKKYLSDLEQRLTTATDNLSKLHGVEDECESLNSELSSLKNTLVEKSELVMSLRSEKDDIETRYKEENLKLSNEIRDKERRIVNLSDEIDLLKRGEDKDGKTADLRLKIVSLQDELQTLKLKKDTESAEEIVKLREELISARERCASLEVDAVDKEEQLKEVMGSIFIQMMNCASLKYQLNTTVQVPDEALKGFNVVGGGSSESNLYIYKAIKSTCMKYPDKKVLVIDISTDSYIDVEFKVARVQTPINWLNGIEPFEGFVANTCFKNVKVLSTALAYMNPLALLLIDWNARLRELMGVADLVFINVGCLDNVVSKILFQSFSAVMKGHIVVRATPINIRTTMLSLAGFSELNDTEVVCMNYDKTSNSMYQKLAGRYKSKIMTEKDGLGVE